MAVVNMTKRTSYLEGYHYTETIATGATGKTLIIPPYIAGKQVTCRIICGAGTGKIQTSISTDSAVAAETATWEDHPDGNQTGTFSDVLNGPVTGIRGVSISGEITLEVLV